MRLLDYFFIIAILLAIFTQKANIGCAIIPNFSVGMVLLQQAASVAAKFYDNIELIEMHHNQKADSPSGTCIKTAEMIEEYPKKYNQSLVKETESLKGVRGGLRDSGLNIHSIRLPGLLAHQVVIMGSPGETYTIKHDTIDRKAYMPGVLQAIRKIGKFDSLIYGLEKFRATIEEFRLENTDGCGAFIRNSSSGRLQFSDKIPTRYLHATFHFQFFWFVLCHRSR